MKTKYILFAVIGFIIVTSVIYLIMTEKIRSFIPAYIRISSDFGKRVNPISKNPEFHNGLDLVSPVGSPVLAFNSGVVSAFKNDLGGEQMTITGVDGLRTGYAHLQNRKFVSGQNVLKGQKIAEIGLTGKTTGGHLHFTAYKKGNYIDPKTILV